MSPRLPKSWNLVSLSELGAWRGGGTPSKAEPSFWNGSIPWVSPKDMKTSVIADAADRITHNAIEQSATKLVPSGSVLVVTRSGILERTLPVATTSRPVTINQDLKALTPHQGISARYVALGLKAFEQQILRDCTKSGTTVANVKFSSFLRFQLPLAPRDEQDRIVAEVEKQFTRLDAGVAALERVALHLKRYRAAVLKSACEGRLVLTEAELARREGRDFESGDKLLSRIRKERRARWEADQFERFKAAGKTPKDDRWKLKYVEPALPDLTSSPELPDGWTWARWEQVGFSQNGRPFPSSDYSDVGVKLLRPGNLHVTGGLTWTAANTRCLPTKYAAENPDLVVRGGELVINLTAQSLKDEFLGRVCLTPPREECLLNQRLARLTPVLLDRRYCLWMFKAPGFRRFVDGLNKGSLIQHMFTTQVADFLVPVPPLAEQIRIADEVERHMSVLQSLEAALSSGLTKASAVRSAVLNAAFHGELVDQDPHDGAASALVAGLKKADQAIETAAVPGVATKRTREEKQHEEARHRS